MLETSARSLRAGRRPLDRGRAFVKVQDGCSFNCNFCVIPLVETLSQPVGCGILARSPARVRQGHREVVLTGINLGCFRDRRRFTLARLVREAGSVPAWSVSASRRSRSTT